MILKSSREASMESTFDQQHPDLIMVHSTKDVAVGTVLIVLSTLDKWYRSGMFINRHKLKMVLKNARP